MHNTEIIVIGAGATGLMAAKTLATAGKKVTILEARNRIGGRIHTVYGAPFATHAEMGAEFVHGKLPVTLALLKEADIAYHETEGSMWRHKDGKLLKNEAPVDGWDKLVEALKSVEEDLTIEAFLEQYFPGDEHAALRQSVARYASGYDTADIKRASTMALRDEWLAEDDAPQYRTESGYGRMITYLADVSKAHGAEIYLNSIVKRINWHEGQAQVITKDGDVYTGQKVIIAVPAGVLQAKNNSEAFMEIVPALPDYQAAIAKLGFGAIIKVLLQFSEPFWATQAVEQLAGDSMSDMQFIFSEEEVPTWWTQQPKRTSMLTGWLGGPKAATLKNASNEELLQRALQTLSNIFKISVDQLSGLLTAYSINNWTAEPFTLGSYSYATTRTKEAIAVLSKPVANTVYFAGEALYAGKAMGTVEAALTSGVEVANLILDK